jgi:UDP-glucose 4-epimerase
MGSSREVVHLNPRNEVKVAFCDHSKVHRVFGKTPEFTLPVGIRAMAEWVKTCGARESSIFENIEVTKNMPASWARLTGRAVGGVQQ